MNTDQQEAERKTQELAQALVGGTIIAAGAHTSALIIKLNNNVTLTCRPLAMSRQQEIYFPGVEAEVKGEEPEEEEDVPCVDNRERLMDCWDPDAD